MSSAWCKAMPTWRPCSHRCPSITLVFTALRRWGKVAQAAAQNLTPTTLELGGKSPHHRRPLRHEGRSPQDRARQAPQRRANLHCARLCAAARAVKASLPRPMPPAVARLFPTIEGNGDYASIITARHHARLRTMLQQAQTQGRRGADHRPDRWQARWCTPPARWAMA